MHLRLYENYRFVLYAPFYAAHAIGAYAAEGLTVGLLPSPGVGLAEQALLGPVSDWPSKRCSTVLSTSSGQARCGS